MQAHTWHFVSRLRLQRHTKYESSQFAHWLNQSSGVACDGGSVELSNAPKLSLHASVGVTKSSQEILKL